MSKTSLLAIAVVALSVFSASSGLDCNDDIIRGVNLGGWLLLEPWITPSIFDEVNEEGEAKIVDEYTYAQYVDPAFYTYRLTKHWDEFVTREDFEKLKAAGISHIRIPVGYWMFETIPEEPFPPPPQSDDEGMRFFLKRAVKWCDEIGLKVLIDMHGAPGSQNGFDNSGKRGDVEWFSPGQHKNIYRTIIANTLAAELLMGWVNDGTIKSETFYGMEILNEPVGWDEDLWEECRDRFYPDSYTALREVMPEQYAVVVQQAFRNQYDFVGYMPESEGFVNVAADMHEYHAFGEYWNTVATQPDQWDVNVAATCDYTNIMNDATLATFVGEWSLATSDCQEHLDGGYGAPYVPPNGDPDYCANYANGDFENYSEDHKTNLARYMNAQMDAYEAGAGYFFWTFKTENNCAPEWDFLFLLENGIAPANLCERETVCSNKK